MPTSNASASRVGSRCDESLHLDEPAADLGLRFGLVVCGALFEETVKHGDRFRVTVVPDIEPACRLVKIRDEGTVIIPDDETQSAASIEAELRGLVRVRIGVWTYWWSLEHLEFLCNTTPSS